MSVQVPGINMWGMGVNAFETGVQLKQCDISFLDRWSQACHKDENM